jgi:hypothetical protein
MLALTLTLMLAQEPALTPGPAPAGAPLSTEALKDLTHTYVRGERMAAIPFGISGLSQALAGSLLLTSNSDIARGAAVPLLIFGGVELIAAVLLGVRNQEVKLDELLAEDKGKFLEHERKHAHRIVHVYQPALLAVEAVALATGGALAGGGAVRGDDKLLGVGLGLAIGSLVLFVLDWAVLDRAQAYETALR